MDRIYHVKVGIECGLSLSVNAENEAQARSAALAAMADHVAQGDCNCFIESVTDDPEAADPLANCIIAIRGEYDADNATYEWADE